jgi:type III pantothenate kinase
MRLIAVDIGNSSTKFGISKDTADAMDHFHAVSNREALTKASMQWLTEWAQPGEEALNWAVCSVNETRTIELESWVRKNRSCDDFHVIGADDIELVDDVQSREMLGRDRLLAAWQARRIFPTGPLVIVDAGTAVTMDVVDASDVFRGGLIFPGAATMLQMLANQTASLPDLSDVGIGGITSSPGSLCGSHDSSDWSGTSAFPTIGKSTHQALLIGVYQTQLSTLRNVIESTRQLFSGSITVVTTGGGMVELQRWLPADWHYRPSLLLDGVAAIGRKMFAK